MAELARDLERAVASGLLVLHICGAYRAVSFRLARRAHPAVRRPDDLTARHHARGSTNAPRPVAAVWSRWCQGRAWADPTSRRRASALHLGASSGLWRCSSSHMDTGPRSRSRQCGPGLGRVEDRAAPAAPRHVPAVAATPHRANRPPAVAVAMAVRAACRRHHNPTALRGDEVAHEVVRKLVAPRFGHRDVLPRTSDRGLNAVHRRRRRSRRETLGHGRKVGRPAARPLQWISEGSIAEVSLTRRRTARAFNTDRSEHPPHR
jgi:hypothetical protein